MSKLIATVHINKTVLYNFRKKAMILDVGRNNLDR